MNRLGSFCHKESFGETHRRSLVVNLRWSRWHSLCDFLFLKDCGHIFSFFLLFVFCFFFFPFLFFLFFLFYFFVLLVLTSMMMWVSVDSEVVLTVSSSIATRSALGLPKHSRPGALTSASDRFYRCKHLYLCDSFGVFFHLFFCLFIFKRPLNLRSAFISASTWIGDSIYLICIVEIWRQCAYSPSVLYLPQFCNKKIESKAITTKPSLKDTRFGQ